jgi:hypothetical protein
MYAAGTVAVSWLEELKLVATGMPLKITNEPGIKLFPNTLITLLTPVVRVEGLTMFMLGNGLSALTIKGKEPNVSTPTTKTVKSEIKTFLFFIFFVLNYY